MGQGYSEALRFYKMSKDLVQSSMFKSCHFHS